MQASYLDHVDVVKLLLEAGADKEVKEEVRYASLRFMRCSPRG